VLILPWQVDGTVFNPPVPEVSSTPLSVPAAAAPLAEFFSLDVILSEKASVLLVPSVTDENSYHFHELRRLFRYHFSR
jgi:hypothetical protein